MVEQLCSLAMESQWWYDTTIQMVHNSTVQANTDAGFSIITYTGTGLM